MTEPAGHLPYTPGPPAVQTRAGWREAAVGARAGGVGPGKVARGGFGPALGRAFGAGGVVLAVLGAPALADDAALAARDATELERAKSDAAGRIGAVTAAETDAGAVWTGFLEACLSMMDRRVVVPSLGKGWRPKGFGLEIGGQERLRDYAHRPTGALGQLHHDRAEKRVSFCGTSVSRHFPANLVREATEDWAARETAAGHLTETGPEPGSDRELNRGEGLVWTYDWCGPNGSAAKIRLQVSEFPPARMDIYRIDDCAEEG